MGEGGLGDVMDILDNGSDFCRVVAEETVEREVRFDEGRIVWCLRNCALISNTPTTGVHHIE